MSEHTPQGSDEEQMQQRQPSNGPDDQPMSEGSSAESTPASGATDTGSASPASAGEPDRSVDEGEPAPSAPTAASGEPAAADIPPSDPAMSATPVEAHGDLGPLAAPTSESDDAEDDLTARFVAELSRVRSVVNAAERAAMAVGLTTATTGGRIECDYDLQGDVLSCRSVSFDLEF